MTANAPSAVAVFRDAGVRLRCAPTNLGALIVIWLGANALQYLTYYEWFRPAGLNLTIRLAALVTALVADWHVSRTIALAQSSERGAIIPWMGWGILASLPILGIFATPHLFTPSSERWADTVVYALAVSLLLPIWIHSTGKAINAHRTSLNLTFSFWKLQWLALASLLFLLACAGFGLSELLMPTSIQPFADPEIFVRSIAAAIADTIVLVVCVATYVSAWRMTPDAAPVARDEAVG